MDLKFWEKYPLDAGFTTAEEDGPLVREKMLAKAVAEGKCLVRPVQVHSDLIAAVKKEQTIPGLLGIENVDGVITDCPGVILTSSHGDCLPIYMYDPVKSVIGLAHSGWKGCLAGIGVNMLNAMEEEFGCDPENVICYIGPGIGYCCFEVQKDVMEAFADEYPWAEEDYILRKNNGRFNIDLKGLTMELLQLNGIAEENIAADKHCTCCEPDLFWSYRRNGEKKRHLAYLEIKTGR